MDPPSFRVCGRFAEAVFAKIIAVFSGEKTIGNGVQNYIKFRPQIVPDSSIALEGCQAETSVAAACAELSDPPVLSELPGCVFRDL